MLICGPIVIHPERRQVFTLHGKPIPLSGALLNALLHLAAADGQVVSRLELSAAALVGGMEAGERTLDTLICGLRRRLPLTDEGQRVVLTIRNVGYWMKAPVRLP